MFSANGEEIVFFRTGSLPELVIYNTINQQFVTISNNDSYIFPQFSFNGNHIIYRNFQSYNLIDINGQNQIFTFEGYTEYYPCSIFENEMTFSSDNQIIKMNIDGTELMNLGVGNHPQFSPDGSKIAFDGLSVMNSDGTERQTLTDEIGEYPHFSPDGTKIVFIMERYEE